MSFDGPTLDDPAMPDGPPTPAGPAVPTRSQVALAEYEHRLRPARRLYAAAITIVVLAVLVIVKIAYNRGEISHAVLKTATQAAPSVTLIGPSSTPTAAWTSRDHTAIGTPYWDGTVITYSTHTVSGRDARTGLVRWSYTRSDRTVCQAVQMSGLTLAIFEVNGNCDEVTTLDSGTGARKWTRTLDKDGQPLNGRPVYVVAQYTLMMRTPDVIYAIDPVSSYDRWVFGQKGCRITGAALGSAGALISQDCTDPACSGKTFCGRGPQLLLRDPTAGESDDSKNPDQIKWNLIGNSATPVSADAVISAARPDSSELTVLAVAKGTTVSTLALQAPAGQVPAAVAAQDAELITTGGYTYKINSTGTAIDWSAATVAAPTVTATDASTTPALSAAYVAVPAATGLDLLDAGTGAVSRHFAVPAPAAGSRVYPFGTGFVVAGPSTQVLR